MSEPLSRFSATPADVDRHLRMVLAEDTYLRYQRAIGTRAVAEAADDVRRVNPDRSAEFSDGMDWATDWIDPAKGGGPYPSVLLCSRHEGFGPCPGAPRCTPNEIDGGAS